MIYNNFILFFEKMHKPIKRSWEFFKYTGNITFTIKMILLLGIIPILGRIFFNKKLESILIKLSKKRGKEILFKTPFGEFIAKTTNGYSVLTQDYEPLVRKVMLKNYEKNKDKKRIFINIGSHIGRWLIEFSKVYGYKGIAFEASEETFKYLKINTLLSDINNNVELFNFGLSNTTGVKKFKYLQHHDGHSHIVTEDEPQNDIITIETKIFDELDLGIRTEDIKLIMIDVEGHEYQVLQGMKETLKKLKDIDIIAEIFDTDPNKEKTLHFMKELGFNNKRINHSDYLFHK